MQVEYDDQPVELSERFKAALLELMRAECEMMRVQDPDYDDCWESGRCYVGNLSHSQALQFKYGPKDYFDDGLGAFAIIGANSFLTLAEN